MDLTVVGIVYFIITLNRICRVILVNEDNLKCVFVRTTVQ